MIAALNNASIQFQVTEKEKNNNAKLEEAILQRRKLEAKRSAELNLITGEKIEGKAGRVVTIAEQEAPIYRKYSKDFEKVESDIAKFRAGVVILNTELSKYEKAGNKENKISELDKALQQFNKEILQGENLLKAGKLFAVSGQDSFALHQLNAIDKAIKTIAGISGPAAEQAIGKLLQQENAIYDKYYSGKPKISRAELDTSPVFKDTSYRTTDKYTGVGEKSLDPKRTANNMAMLDKEASRIVIEGETEKAKEIRKLLKMQEQDYVNFANTVSSTATNSIMGLWDAMEKGENISDSIGQMFANLTKQIAAAVIQAAIFASILSLVSGGAAGGGGGVSFFGAFKNILGLADGGVATGPTLAMIGEGSESEAVLPLSKLGNIMQGSFNAGSMSGNSAAQNGQFVLRGNDLVLALNRSEKSLNLRNGS
jgi:hypothetical protein